MSSRSKVDQDGHDLPHPVSRQSAAVLDVVKTRPGNGRACLDVGATAGLDDICAAAWLIPRSGRKNACGAVEQKNGSRETKKEESRGAHPLTTKAPYKSLTMKE